MFELPEEVKRDSKKYLTGLHKFLKGDTSPERFRGLRVPWGFYSQRGGDDYMSRIRVPGGHLSGEQLTALARTAEKLSPEDLHLTTRQDVQIHSLAPPDTEQILKELSAYNLSPRGGGGNTVRNVTGCAAAGICPHEEFDTSGYAPALSEVLLRDPNSFNLPRKYKIAFSGCSRDCGLATVNDLGFIAREDQNGSKGFTVYAGGGLGNRSAVARKLMDFIPAEEAGFVAEALRRIFFQHGNRKNKNRARLRFLVEELGFDEFSRLFHAELERLQSAPERERFLLRPSTPVTFPPPAESASKEHSPGAENPDLKPEYRKWLKHSTFSQKQKGYRAVRVLIPGGDIDPDTLGELGRKADEQPSLAFRLTRDQNLLLIGVPEARLQDFHAWLGELDLDDPYTSTVLDVTACKGARTCNLGLCNSPGLAEKLEEALRDEDLEPGVLQGIRIKVNGCPNACGHHPLGFLALQGVSRKVGLKPVPCYRVFVGGRVQEGSTRLAEPVGIVPARRAVELVKNYLLRVQSHLEEGQKLYSYLEEEGREELERMISEPQYADIPPYEEAPEYYRDWGSDEDFSLAGLGRGECGAGVTDMIEADLEEAENLLARAEENDLDSATLSQALHVACRTLLVVRGVEPANTQEVIYAFLEHFVSKGLVEQKFASLPQLNYRLDQAPDEEERRECFQLVSELFAEVQSLYEHMDSSFEFPTLEDRQSRSPSDEEEAEEGPSRSGSSASSSAHGGQSSDRGEASSPGAQTAATENSKKEPGKGVGENTEKKQDSRPRLDLRGVECPLNYVKAKLFLEQLAPGTEVTLLLDDGEPISNVHPSLENDGHEILNKEKAGEYYRLEVKKAVD